MLLGEAPPHSLGYRAHLRMHCLVQPQLLLSQAAPACGTMALVTITFSFLSMCGNRMVFLLLSKDGPEPCI